jgi:hypothetical protein
VSVEQIAESPRTRRGAELVFGAVLMVLGLLFVAVPALLARRFSFAAEHEEAIARVLRAGGPALLAMAAAAFVASTRWAELRPGAAALAIGLLTVAGYVSLTTCLSDWMVDDAAITFAYSKNLAAGHGLVISAGHAPEEGYSNTSWMLILAACRVLGADIAVTAKRACVAFGALAVGLSLFTCYHLLGRRVRFGMLALGTSICLGAPFIIWSCSGLEHSLQAAMLALIVAAPLLPRPGHQRAFTATALSILVLTRPEAPIMVALVGVVLIGRDPSPSWARARAALQENWPVLAAPIATWVALMAFRLAYFHDPLSNPYYAKASDASWVRVLNFVGGGWSYLGGWLAESRAWLVVPVLVLMAPLRRAALSLQLAIAICLGQMLFVLFVGGDWMGCYRFVSPALPALAVVVVGSLAEAGKRWSRLSSTIGLVVLTWFMGIGTVTQLSLFRSHPTTPTSVVSQIARTFLDLGHRLGIERPTLAHHDAGGTTYEVGIDLVDLGGLGDRAVAKHMADREFIRKYLFVDRRPTFIFGSSHVFAAGATQFYRMPEFDAYVRLRFPKRPYMQADLCHVRRDAIHAIPGVRLVKQAEATGLGALSPSLVDQDGTKGDKAAPPEPLSTEVWVVDE